MANYGIASCEICHRTFTKRSHNTLVCSDKCRDEKESRRKHKAPRFPQEPCPICGEPPRVYNGRIYITCGSLSCRKTHRAKQLAKRYKIKPEKAKEGPLMRSCLKCDRKFKAPHKFIRVCPACKGNFQANPTAAEWYGGVI